MDKAGDIQSRDVQEARNFSGLPGSIHLLGGDLMGSAEKMSESGNPFEIGRERIAQA